MFDSAQGARNYARDGDNIQPRPKYLSLRTIIRDWWLEFVACLFLLTTVGAIVVSIRLQQGRPLYHWPYHLSINTVISVYSVVVKAAILLVISEGLGQLKWVWYSEPYPLQDISDFDKASRGEVWGTCRLIWKLRFRSVVSSTAALVTLLVLLVDPFAQQIIQYYSCTVLDTKVAARLPATNRYDFVGRRVEAQYTTIDHGLEAAMYAGMTSPQSISIVSDCASGNCKFSRPVQTLGWCSSCEDITDHIMVYNATVEDPYATDETVRKTNISLPTGLSSAESAETGGIQSFLTTNFDFPGDFHVLASYLDPSKGDACDKPNNREWVCQGAGAATCKLRPCVKSYNSSVANGRFTEVLVDSYTMPDPEYFHSVVNVSCLRPSDITSLERAGHHLDEDAQWMDFAPDVQGQEPTHHINPDLNVPQECVYSVLAVTFVSLWESMNSLLTGSIVPNDDHQLPEAGDGNSTLLAMYRGGNVSFNSVNETMNNLAEAMTAWIREHGAEGWSAPVAGQSFRTDTCVRVEWGWLALPAALTGLTLLFFIVMIFQTRRGEVGHNHNWKSSTLPILFHGLDRDTRYRQGELPQLKAMEESAKHLQVRLTLTDEGWRFSPA